MSGLFKSTTIKGTRLTDFSGTSAEVGKAIPFGYGTFPVDGFIGWAPLPPVEHRKVKRQGKGGVKQETFTYTLSYAVFFCKGPIYGLKWIKRNGKVVYTTDPNAPIEDRQYAAKWAQRVNFHWGTRDQLPDSLIESYEGVGNVSGFPDMFYITVEDEDVTDNGGAPPNYEACVIASPPEAYLTSKPYPIYGQDGVSTAVGFETGSLRPVIHQGFSQDAVETGVSFGVATLRAPLVTIGDQPPEEIDTSITFGVATLRAPLVGIDGQPPEEIQTTIGFETGIIRHALITHEQPAEEITTTLTFGEASLYEP